jgi:hypothetical protein
VEVADSTWNRYIMEVGADRHFPENKSSIWVIFLTHFLVESRGIIGGFDAIQRHLERGFRNGGVKSGGSEKGAFFIKGKA